MSLTDTRILRIFTFFLTIIVFISLVHSVSAFEFNFTSPNSVEINQEFNVLISSAPVGDFDVKIVVSGNGKIISEIYNNGWKNPYYYLKSVFPNSKEFKARVISSPGEGDICVRLRQTGKSAYSELCKNITITGTVPSDSQNTPNTQKKESTDSQQSRSDSLTEENINNQNTKNGITSSEGVISVVQENPSPIEDDDLLSANGSANENQLPDTQTVYPEPAIILKSPNENSAVSSSDLFTTSKETLRNLMIFSFAIFCLAIILLVLMRKL